MFRRENYLPLIAASTVLTIVILLTFQAYQLREPARLEADAAADLEASVRAGEELFAANCASCHGLQGEGIDAPALNSKTLLSSVSDEQLLGLIRSGVPGTGMPAWAQDFGGSLTDEEIRQIISYLRTWEATAPDLTPQSSAPDPVRGAEIYASICVVCHGEQGAGTDRAPALNDPALLATFDDDWFRETIAQGRPSGGMPTWGTVLSPADIDNLVALLAAWREGVSVDPAAAAGPPDGEALFAANCAACHGARGEGGVGPALLENTFVASQSDADLAAFLLAGRPGTAMTGFEGRMTRAQVTAIVELLRSWEP